MTLAEALKLSRQVPPDATRALELFLACSFTPLHLETFLAAHLRRVHLDRKITLRTGLYGDCLGTLERLPAAGGDAGVVVLEWPDFDPRLGIRQLGGWGPADLRDILRTARAQAERLRSAVEQAAASMLVVVSLPALPLPPMFYTP